MVEKWFLKHRPLNWQAIHARTQRYQRRPSPRSADHASSRQIAAEPVVDPTLLSCVQIFWALLCASAVSGPENALDQGRWEKGNLSLLHQARNKKGVLREAPKSHVVLVAIDKMFCSNTQTVTKDCLR